MVYLVLGYSIERGRDHILNEKRGRKFTLMSLYAIEKTHFGGIHLN